MNSPYKELAVSDFATGGVETLGPSFHTKNTITNGLGGADGDWIDAAKNLYVANYAGVNVQEYASGSTSPTFTYSAGLKDPINVTTDKKGNVYVADYQADAVVEYAQGVNTVVAQCTVGGGVEGVAVDSSGNVFASYNNAQTGAGNLVEYTGGLAGCEGTTLTPTLGTAGGIQIANDGTLVAADQNVGVDLIPIPYTAIASTITGAVDPFHISLTKYNKLLFIADPANADVLVVHYPSGSSYLTLGAANGLSDPAGVAAYEIGTN